MSHLLGFLVVLWTLASAPVLCVSGVLAHACDAEIVGHEEACSSDPCPQPAEPGASRPLPAPAVLPMPVCPLPLEADVAWRAAGPGDAGSICGVPLFASGSTPLRL